MRKMLINNKNFTILMESDRKKQSKRDCLRDDHHNITLEDHINEKELHTLDNHIFNII